MIERHRGHQLTLPVFVDFPAAHVMTAGDDAGFDSFGHPGAHHKVTNLSFHAHQIAGAHAEFRRMARVQPERVRVRDFIQPLRVRAARVNLNRQTEG